MGWRWALIAAGAWALMGAGCEGSGQDKPVSLTPPEQARFGTAAPEQTPAEKVQDRWPAQLTTAPPAAAKIQDRLPGGPDPGETHRLQFKADPKAVLEQAQRTPGPAPALGRLVESSGPLGGCAAVPGVGCFLARPGAQRLLIYMRGHLTRRLPSGSAVKSVAHLPDNLLTESASDAVEQYDLRRAADGLGASLLVTGSSHVPIDVEKLKAAGVPVPQKIVVAAHSGAIVGLGQSLDRLPPLEGLVLLDPFFGVDSGGLAGVARKLQPRLSSGNMKCGGFYTPPFYDKRGYLLSDTRSAYKGTFAPALGAQASKCQPIEAPSHSAGHADHILRVMR